MKNVAIALLIALAFGVTSAAALTLSANNAYACEPSDPGCDDE